MSSQRYYVDFYDAFDGWGDCGFRSERLFDSLDEARACRDRLNADLAEGNKRVGEHWEIIDRTVGCEVDCVRQRGLGEPAPESLE